MSQNAVDASMLDPLQQRKSKPTKTTKDLCFQVSVHMAFGCLAQPQSLSCPNLDVDPSAWNRIQAQRLHTH